MEKTKDLQQETVMDLQKEKIRSMIRGVYDIQKLRVATGNRIVASFNAQLGHEPSTKMDDMDPKAKKLIVELKNEYNRITDAYIENKESINKTIKSLSAEQDEDKRLKYINTKFDYDLVKSYTMLLESEELQIAVLTAEVKRHPMWEAFFENVKGCGPMMAAVCIAYFDIDKARHVSSFWKYAGLDVVQVYKRDDEDGNPVFVGEGRSKKAEHLEEVEYKDREGKTCIKKGITFNPELKTKLLGVLGTSFLKTGRGDKYEQIYRDYRARLANRVDLKAEYNDKGEEIDKNKARRHNMANRYMVKQFVRDLWVTWRELAGYEVSEPYEVAKLGMKPHKYNEYHERVAQETKRA